jgi:acyl-CoA synthetase (AMP-forming)/AMP-acid ligase II
MEGAEHMEHAFGTLVDALRWRAEHQPEQPAVTFLLDGEQEEATGTYRQLDERARTVAAALREQGATGGRALLLHPPGLEFIAALFGCFYAGVAAVPTYPPPFNRHSRSALRLAKLVQDAQPVVALTTAANLDQAEWFSHQESGLGTLPWMGTDSLPAAASASGDAPALAPDSLALIQYTSGSTSWPKGVQLSHGNLLANLEAIAAKFRHTATSRGVIWLPPYHDMGLIGGILQPIVYGFPVYLMAPLDVLQKPLRWLGAISRYRATTSGGPNFAYDLCVRSIPPEKREQLDLSSWQVAFNGAEPVRAETLERFTQAFRPCGFRPEALYPCYGLAEATLFVSGGEQGTGPTTRTFDRQELARRRAVPVPEAIRDRGVTLVSHGQPADKHRVVLVDPDSGRPCPEAQLGEIWVAGPSVAQGYWDRPDDSRAAFQNVLAGIGNEPFLRTGDLGFVHRGELFLVGRLKDLIIVQGRKYYPQDIEEAAEGSHPALLVGASAAFAVDLEGAEQIVVACEVKREERRQLDTSQVIQAVREAVAAALELPVYGVVLLKPGSLPRTTSGKIQRSACRTAFLQLTSSSREPEATAPPVVASRTPLHWEPIALECVAAAPAEEPAPPDEPPNSLSSPVALDRITLREAPEAERLPLLRQYLTQRLAAMLKTPEHWLDLQRPLGHLGIDSLMWMELLLQLEADLDVSVPLESVTPDTTLPELTEVILRELSREA